MRARRIKISPEYVDSPMFSLLRNEEESFEASFPDIEDIVIEVEEHSPNIDREKRTRVFQKQNVRDFIGCQNPRCQGGGFFVYDIINEMRGDKKTKLSTWKACIGNESAEGSSNTVQYCINSFNIGIRIKYKNNIPWPFTQ